MLKTRTMRKKYKEYADVLEHINLDNSSIDDLNTFEQNFTQNLALFKGRVMVTQGYLSKCENYLICLKYHPTLFSGFEAAITRYAQKIFTEQLQILQNSVTLTESFLIRIRWKINSKA